MSVPPTLARAILEENYCSAEEKAELVLTVQGEVCSRNAVAGRRTSSLLAFVTSRTTNRRCSITQIWFFGSQHWISDRSRDPCPSLALALPMAD
ncbi:hypothetical protein TIFTF001_025218 [Ficus carica]|uniref:Uncharacterized protein n=1 Tax=Ficus carica TaxID=3494 RepID=A0AA88AJG5_FICCA|nr:hypothetical protein TIFTF001_025218 [Ficus carica]